MRYVDVPGGLLRGKRWEHQDWPARAVTDPMTCPGCSSHMSPQPVVYGYPSIELVDAAERGDVFLGGCVVYRDFPSHRCPTCGIGLGRAARA